MVTHGNTLFKYAWEHLHIKSDAKVIAHGGACKAVEERVRSGSCQAGYVTGLCPLGL